MFVGRKKELSLLNELWDKPHAAFVICKGRRRIGKSTLIEKFGEHADSFFEFQGAAPDAGISNQDQMDIFKDQLCMQAGIPQFQPESWQQVFSFLAMAVKGRRKTVILLDEISWMASKSKSFSAILKIVWDTKFKKFPNLVLVVCGSVSSWINENILNNTGFMGRVSLELTLSELPLHHCNQFWLEKSKEFSGVKKISHVEKLKVLSVTGGVPRYLEEINPTMDAEKNIKRLCFEKEGILFNEFGRIFNDIFDRKAGSYKKIIKALVSGSKTLSQISDSTGKVKSGHITACLNDLLESGFISKDKVYSIQTVKETRRTCYRLKDNYLRFYLKYIEPLSDRIRNNLYENAAIEDLINWDTIMGLQFENLVLNNLSSVIRLCSINPNSVLSASPYFQNRTAKQQACQADLIIRTKYSVYVCEIKFRKKIGKGVIDEVFEKISRMKFTDVLSIRPVLIYEGLLSENVLKEDFFDRIIKFSDLLVE